MISVRQDPFELGGGHDAAAPTSTTTTTAVQIPNTRVSPVVHVATPTRMATPASSSAAGTGSTGARSREQRTCAATGQTAERGPAMSELAIRQRRRPGLRTPVVGLISLGVGGVVAAALLPTLSTHLAPTMMILPVVVVAAFGSYWSPCGSSMAGVIVSQSGRTWTYGRIAASHSLGAGLAGSIAGLLAATAARVAFPTSTLAFGSLLLVAGMWEGLMLPIPYLQSRAQAPRAWSVGGRRATVALLYGLYLGSNVFTRIGSAAYYGVLGGSLLVLDPADGALMFMLYGLCKTWPVWVFGLASASRETNLDSARIIHTSRTVRRSMHLVTGVVLITSAVWFLLAS